MLPGWLASASETERDTACACIAAKCEKRESESERACQRERVSGCAQTARAAAAGLSTHCDLLCPPYAAENKLLLCGIGASMCA